MMNRQAAQERPLPVSSYFEPDILTSHQYFKVFREKSHLGPEEKLMFAVLTDAIECYQKYLGLNGRRRRTLFAEAETWITSKDASWPYSFDHICEILNINPNYLRLGLLQWRVSHESQKNPRKRIREPLRYQYRVKHNRVTI
jgi:hypothetical protein